MLTEIAIDIYWFNPYISLQYFSDLQVYKQQLGRKLNRLSSQAQESKLKKKAYESSKVNFKDISTILSSVHLFQPEGTKYRVLLQVFHSALPCLSTCRLGGITPQRMTHPKIILF